MQSSIRKRATAFVDARDDLETKIGRLSRRLNFLMTESDLWRDKFVSFEQFAEKLSNEEVPFLLGEKWAVTQTSYYSKKKVLPQDGGS